MVATAKQIHEISIEEIRNVSVDMTAMLGSTETLSGNLDIQASNDVTVTNVQANIAAITINSREVPIGQALLFTVTCSTVGRYTIDALCETSEGQTIESELSIVFTDND